MATLKSLEKDIQKLKERNKRVEAGKAWETSRTRKILVGSFTYMVIVLFFYFAKLPKPFINSIVPAVAFVLSTSSLPIIKKWWIEKKRFTKK